MTALLIAAAVSMPTVADHPDPLGWTVDWNRRVSVEGLSRPLVDEFRIHTSIVRELRPFQRAPQAAVSDPSHRPAPVEGWRPLIAEHFPVGNVDRALRVIACESGGDPEVKNPRSSAAGLFQFIRSTWDWVAGVLGLPSYDAGGPYDPVNAARAAAWLSDGGADWTHWECRP